MLFPVLCAHISVAKFQHFDLGWKGLCGQMFSLMAESGGNKGQLTLLVHTGQFGRSKLPPLVGVNDEFARSKVFVVGGVSNRKKHREKRKMAIPH